jgi:aminoglycoside phosphotransferase (APT) family kinase protein
MAGEARTMDYLRSHGYPVPAVEEISADGTDLVMERIDGRSMVDDMGRRPWTIRHQGAVLADLHRRLHAIPPPSFLAPAPVGPVEGGGRLLHLDLHPLNVMISSRGPVVIDWPNAVRGDPAVDVGVAWMLMAVGEIPGGRMKAAALGFGRSLLVKSFLASFDLAPVKAVLRDVVSWKIRDANILPAEQQAMWRIVESLETDL